MKRKLLTTTFLMAIGMAVAVPGLTDPQDVCEFEGVVVFATNSVQIDKNSTVTGDVVANAASPGPVLDEGAEVAVDRAATVHGNISGDSIDLDRTVTVNGNLFYTEGELVDDGATVNGTLNPGLALPVFEELPEFQAADVLPGAADVLVATDDTVTLGAAPDRVTNYGDVVIEKLGTLVFTGGGTFDVRSITTSDAADVACADPCYRVVFEAPTAVRVEGRLFTHASSYVGPQPGSGIAASDIVVYVGGSNGTSGDLFDVPPAVNIGRDSTVEANFYVPNGTLEIDKNSSATGAFLGRDVRIKRDTTVALDTAFLNLPPVADPQSVSTSGDGAILITLTGSDPEEGDLAFEIVAQPTYGSLSEPQEIVPAPIPVLDREGNPTGEVIQPPITSATVIYDPESGQDLSDAFLFQVFDPCGAVGVAAVDINSDDPAEPCPVVPVAADDVEADTTPNGSVVIALAGEGPDCGANLVYRITSLPTDGTLSDSADNPIDSVPYTLPDALVIFTAGGDSGTFGFGYDVSETAGTASATVTVTVGAPPQLAEDSSVETPLNSPVVVTLQANPGGTGTESAAPATSAAPAGPQPAVAGSSGAAIAGNVSDADGDGLGDGRDNLPGPAPVLIAAGVDVNLDATPAGDVSDPAGDATDLESDDPANPDLISASVSSDGTNLNLEVRFVEAGFDPDTSRASFVLDTDENPATGFPGIDAANNDAEIMGLEFLVDIGGDPEDTVAVEKFISLPNNFTTVGTFTATVLADGYDVAIPLATLDGDDGNLAFKVVTQSRITESGFTGILDYMPDVGLAPGESSTAGIQGIARIQIEWNISNLTLDEGDTAQVVLTTEKGTVDELDTMFYVGTADQDGLLTVSDFQTPADPLPNAVMPVPPDAQTGDMGTFAFDVTTELGAAIAEGFDFFTIQGRVAEDEFAGGGFRRGLQVYSTATGNLALGREPKLEISGEQPPPAVLVTVIAPLPASGFLTTNTDPPLPVGVGAQFTSTTNLVYTPSFGFAGTDTISYSVSEGTLTDIGTILVRVLTIDPCVFNGREPGCYPLDGGELTGSAPAEQPDDGTDPTLWSGPRGEIPNLRVVVEGDGTGSVASSRRETPAGSFAGLVCDRRCGKNFPNGTEVSLYARPIGDDSEFIRWAGDCAGTEAVTQIRIWGRHLCIAEFGKK